MNKILLIRYHHIIARILFLLYTLVYVRSCVIPISAFISFFQFLVVFPLAHTYLNLSFTRSVPMNNICVHWMVCVRLNSGLRSTSALGWRSHHCRCSLFELILASISYNLYYISMTMLIQVVHTHTHTQLSVWSTDFCIIPFIRDIKCTCGPHIIHPTTYQITKAYSVACLFAHSQSLLLSNNFKSSNHGASASGGGGDDDDDGGGDIYIYKPNVILAVSTFPFRFNERIYSYHSSLIVCTPTHARTHACTHTYNVHPSYVFILHPRISRFLSLFLPAASSSDPLCIHT